MDINRRRLWMNNRNFPERRGLRPSFVAGVMEFLDIARTTDDYLRHDKIKCPCENCKCVKTQDLENVEEHLQNLENIHGGRSSPVVEKKENRTISIPEMHKIRHIKSDKKGGEVWVEPRAKEAWERATKAVEEWTSTQQSECGSSTPASLTLEQETNLWLEVNGGVKKGFAYGLATLYSSRKHKSNYLGSCATAPSSSADPGEMAWVKEEIAELKRQNEAMRLANEAHQREMHEMMQKLLKRQKKSKGKRKSRRRHSSSSESDAESSSGSSQ